MCSNLFIFNKDSNGGHDDVHGQRSNELFRWNRRLNVKLSIGNLMLILDSFQSTLRRRLLLRKDTLRQWTGGRWGSLYMR